MWTIGTLAAGDFETLTVVVRLDEVFPAGTTTVRNIASTTSDQTAEVWSNPVTTEVEASPVFTAGKLVDRATASPGDLLTYTITYDNGGDADASTVVITDVLPPRTTFVSASNGASLIGGTVTWPLGDVASGSSGSVTLVVRLDEVFPNGATVITNSAELTATEINPVNTGPARTTVSASPTLSVVKVVDKAVALAGETLLYTITYSNEGDADASAVFISDALPPRTTYVSATGGGSFSGASVSWTIGSLAAGASGVVSFTVRLDATFPSGTTTIENVAVIDGAEVSAVTSAPAVTEVSAGPRIVLVKTVDLDTARPGDELIYTITYSNDGDADATSVDIADVVPASATYVSATGAGLFDGVSVSWMIGTVPPGGSGSVSFTVLLDDVFAAGTTNVTNVATADSAELATVTSNQVVTVVQASPAFTLTKAVDRGAANPGDVVTYTLTYSNNGDAAATGVAISDVVPGRTTFLSASSPGQLSAGVVTWGLGTVDSGASGSVTFSVQLDAVFPPGTNVVTNVGTIDSSETGVVQSNEVSTNLDASPSFALTKAVDLTRASPGDLLSYTLSYANNGTAMASDVVILDALPARTTLVSTSTGGQLVGGDVQFDLGALTAGESGVVTLVVRLDEVFPNGETVVTNRAQIDSVETTATPSNEVQTTVRAAPELVITKEVDLAVASPGDALTYTLVYSNAGDADADAGVLTDALPPRTSFVSASDGGAASSGIVTWDVGTVAAGASTSVTLTVALDGAFPNGATVVANGASFDADGAAVAVSNIAETVVNAAPALAIIKTVDTATARPGQTLTYTISYANDGDAPAASVTIDDELPARVSFVSATGGATESGGTLSWSLGDLDAGASGTLEVVVRLDDVFPSGSTTISNVAEVSALDATTVTSDPAVTEVAAEPIIVVVKSVDRATASPGDELQYTLTYRNDGDGIATSMIISDTIPANTSYVSGSGAALFDGVTVSWTLATLSPGESGAVTFDVTLDGTFPAGTTSVTNVALVETAQTASEPSNEVVTTVEASPVLSIVKSVTRRETTAVSFANTALVRSAETDPVSSVQTLVEGEVVSEIEYRIEVTNDGDANASDVVIEDALIDELSFSSADRGGTYDGASRSVTWTLSTLSAGSTESFVLTVTVP